LRPVLAGQGPAPAQPSVPGMQQQSAPTAPTSRPAAQPVLQPRQPPVPLPSIPTFGGLPMPVFTPMGGGGVSHQVE
jgi:hypothetical protein